MSWRLHWQHLRGMSGAPKPTARHRDFATREAAEAEKRVMQAYSAADDLIICITPTPAPTRHGVARRLS